MKKNQARKKYKDLRDKLNDLELKKLSNQIYQQSLGLKIWNKNIFMIYKSIKHKREVKRGARSNSDAQNKTAILRFN